VRFIGKNEYLSFEEIDVRWLNRFISYLQKSGLKANTVNFYTRILRAVYNRAWKESVPGANPLSPFRNITINNVKTVKRAIDNNSIQLIAHAQIENNAKLELSRDLFLFSYYSRGMSFVDMAFLKSSNISDDAIYYSRSKTGQPLRIKIVEPLQQLINKYSNNGEYILPILRSGSKSLYTRYRSGLKRHNHCLKLLSESLNLPVPLTSYVARHSWATIARKNGIPVSVISEGLGQSSEKITYTYLAALDPSVLDAANEHISHLCM
jgi:site-specific recombinase XerD